MILKGSDAYFKVPAVETRPSYAQGDQGPVDGEEGPATNSRDRAVQVALAEIADAMLFVDVSARRRPKRHCGPKTNCQHSRGKNEDSAARVEPSPVVELVVHEEDNGEDVFHLSYDAELQCLIAKKMVDPRFLPAGFLSEQAKKNRAPGY